MREFKFRMFIKETGMVYRGIYDQNWYFHPEESKLYREIKQRDHVFPLMQYTGQRDRERKEVYESDIIQLHPETSREDNRVLVRFTHQFGWCVYFNTGLFFHTLYEIKLLPFEIIGNIHENPELLEVK